jgi:aquaporin Z
MEAGELATLMFCICAAGVLFYGRHSVVANAGLSLAARSALMGATVAGATFLIIRSPFGRRTGAHFNPALTLAYLSVARIHRWDALGYILAQFLGGVFGVSVARQILGADLPDLPVRYAVTLPGHNGTLFAFAAELLTSFILMAVVLISSNHRRLAKYSPLFVALVTVFYYVFSTSISGYSVNPARSFSSALFANTWHGIWIYFIAPGLGMVAAADGYKRIAGSDHIYCAKVFHDLRSRCPFACRFHTLYDQSQL